MTNKPQNKITPYGWRQPIPTNLVEFTQGNKFAATIFMILLLRAANKDKEVMVGDNSISIKRGEAVCGVFELAEYCGLKRNEHKRVQRIMEKLEKRYELMTKRRSLNCSVVSIKNYDDWIKMTTPTAERRLNDGLTTGTNKSVKSVESRVVKPCKVKRTIGKRKSTTFPASSYTPILSAYMKFKGITLHGSEFNPIKQGIKTMFLDGRTPDQIIKTIEWISTKGYSWTINTVKAKLPEAISEKGEANDWRKQIPQA